jgi:ribonuclease D
MTPPRPAACPEPVEGRPPALPGPGVTPTVLAVLRELWFWREEEAVASNKPPYFIIPPDAMIRIASAVVSGRNPEEVLPRYLTSRRRKGVLKAVTNGLEEKHPPGPLRVKGHRLNETEKRRLHSLEDRRNHRAARLGIDQTLIASRATLVGEAMVGTKISAL